MRSTTSLLSFSVWYNQRLAKGSDSSHSFHVRVIVTLIFKKGSREDQWNYRPSSLTSGLDKSTETVIKQSILLENLHDFYLINLLKFFEQVKIPKAEQSRAFQIGKKKMAEVGTC